MRRLNCLWTAPQRAMITRDDGNWSSMRRVRAWLAMSALLLCAWAPQGHAQAACDSRSLGLTTDAADNSAALTKVLAACAGQKIQLAPGTYSFPPVRLRTGFHGRERDHPRGRRRRQRDAYGVPRRRRRHLREHALDSQRLPRGRYAVFASRGRISTAAAAAGSTTVMLSISSRMRRFRRASRMW